MGYFAGGIATNYEFVGGRYSILMIDKMEKSVYIYQKENQSDDIDISITLELDRRTNKFEFTQIVCTSLQNLGTKELMVKILSKNIQWEDELYEALNEILSEV